jgi:hypothetical protein
MPIQRNRIHYFLLVCATILIGLVSRSSIVPDMIYAYLGDTLYALMMFWIMAFLFPRKSVLIVAVLSLMVCFSIELSQLYQASWIVEIRKTRLGGLVLGFGFLWSDLISYFVGVVFGFLIEHFIIFRSKK